MTYRIFGISTAALASSLAVQPAFAQQDDANIIIVEAQRENRSEVRASGNLGALGEKKAEDVPFSVRTFDEALIHNQQPQTLGDVLENDPTVRTTYGFGNASEQFVIRGFPLFGDDVGMNGLYGITPRQLVAPELYEGVQVLNGANAFLNGAAPGGTGIGGNVNLQLKQARATPLNRATLNYTSDEHFGGSFDLSRRFGGNEELGARLNGMFRSGDVSIDDEFRETLAVGGALGWSTDNVRLSFNVGYQDIRVDRLRPKVVTSVGIPDVPEADTNYGAPFTSTDLESLFGIARLEYDFDDKAMFYASVGALESDEEGTYGSVTLADEDTGAATGSASIIPAEQSNQAIEAGFRVKLGSEITQEFNLGANISWQEFRTAYDIRGNGYDTNIYDPSQSSLPAPSTNPLVPDFVGGDLADPFPIEKSRLWSVFASDTVGFLNERVLLTAGLRLQTIRQQAFSYFGGAETSDYEEDAITPVVGLVVKPVEEVSLFANRIEGLQQGEMIAVTAPGGATVTNAGEVLAPYRSVQYEIGGKLTFDRWNASLAFFHIEQPSLSYRADPDNVGQVIGGDTGEQRNRGVELFVSGEPVDGLRVIAGGSIIDAELINTADGLYEGNDALGIPEYTANANVEWDTPFVPGLTLTGRVVHTGEQAANESNSLTLDDWTRFDVGARYVLAAGNNPITLRLTVDNVANERYWSSAYDSFAAGNQASLLQGRPRTFKASISADF